MDLRYAALPFDTGQSLKRAAGLPCGYLGNLLAPPGTVAVTRRIGIEAAERLSLLKLGRITGDLTPSSDRPSTCGLTARQSIWR